MIEDARQQLSKRPVRKQRSPLKAAKGRGASRAQPATRVAATQPRKKKEPTTMSPEARARELRSARTKRTESRPGASKTGGSKKPKKKERQKGITGRVQPRP